MNGWIVGMTNTRQLQFMAGRKVQSKMASITDRQDAREPLPSLVSGSKLAVATKSSDLSQYHTGLVVTTSCHQHPDCFAYYLLKLYTHIYISDKHA